jgi:hypothetical protein
LALLSVGGIILFGFGLLRISRFMCLQDNVSILALLLLNPLVWTFSARRIADFLPAAVGVFAISLTLGTHYALPRALAAGILLGFAAILKYPFLCLSVFLIALVWGGDTALTNTDVRGSRYAPAWQTLVSYMPGGKREKLSMLATVSQQGKSR